MAMYLESSAVQTEDEEQWLYGGDINKQEDRPVPGDTGSHLLTDIPKEEKIVSEEERELLQQTLPGREDNKEDSDSDSDDYIQVMIGNITARGPTFMERPRNLSLKISQGYGATTSAKFQPKGNDLDVPGNIYGLSEAYVDLDSADDKPWRKPGADLSDYFNYGFNEETWKAYCEKQHQFHLALKSSVLVSAENQIKVQQGRTRNAEKESDFKADIMASIGGQVKVESPPNRKLDGTSDVIGGEPGTIRRVEGRRRDKHAPEENSIQVLSDNGSKARPAQPPQQPGPQQPTGPPPPIGVPPPLHFFLPWLPVTSSPPLRHCPGLFPQPHSSQPAPSISALDSQSASYNSTSGYNSTASGFISYPPISTSHMPWMCTASSTSKSGHWEYSGSRKERDCDQTPATSKYNDDERDYYYSREHSYNFEQDYHSRDNSWERKDCHQEQRHRDKEEASKHKSWCNDEKDYYYSQERSYDFEWDYRSRDTSREQEDHHREQRHRDKEETIKHKSWCKQHESKEDESHRRHKHKKNKRNKKVKE